MVKMRKKVIGSIVNISDITSLVALFTPKPDEPFDSGKRTK